MNRIARRLARISAALIVLCATALPAYAQTGTVMPSPKFQGLDASGAPCAACLLYTYEAGTTTPLATYSDVNLSVPNANPVVLDSAGRATVYLSATSYKFVLQTSASVTVWTQDNVSAVPGSSANLDVAITAGEALTAGNAVYLSDGSGAKTAGRWYQADATTTYSSSLAGMVGIVTTDVASGASGTVRIGGRYTALSGLTAGATYYVSGTPGAVTSTAPGNVRFVGTADSTTTIVLSPNPQPLSAVTQPIDMADGRLTCTTAVPVTTTDCNGVATLYYTPYTGNRIALYNGSVWSVRTFSEITISVSTCTASKPYDVFLYDNAGTVTAETLVWTDATTRATALTLQNGVYVKSGATTRRYIGTFYCNASGGQTDDSATKRYLWNYYHRVPRLLRKAAPDASWTYTTATIRQAAGNTANKVEAVIGVAESLVALTVRASLSNNGTNPHVAIGIGEDSTTTFSSSQIGGALQPIIGGSAYNLTLEAAIAVTPAVGYHYYSYNEYSSATGTTTWNGTDTPSVAVAGLMGSIQ